MVTGGAGFIGSHLVRELVRRGADEIVALDSLRYGDPGNLAEAGANVRLVKHRLGYDDEAGLTDALSGVTHLFHLAAEKHNQSKDNPESVYRANLLGMHGLLEQAVRAGVKKVVFSSSLYAHGRLRGEPLSEDDVPAPRTVYGITKLGGEHMLGYFQEHAGLSFNVLRYFFIYGPRQFAGMGYRSVIVKNFERLLDGEKVIVRGDGEQALDYVYVDDCVDATIAAAFSDVNGATMNIASGRATTINELLDTMTSVAGASSEKVREPADWTQGTRRAGTTERAQKLLGWKATTPLRVGLERTLAWMRDVRAS